MTLTCASDRAVKCGTPWDFDLPLAIDSQGGTNAVVSVVSTITNQSCGATFQAVRTWSVTDDCGVSTTCTQTITVQDISPPEVFPGASRTVDSRVAWDFDQPAVFDACDPHPSLAVLTTITNPACGNAFAATRTWIATDACGNTNTGSQTITVVDATQRQVSCGPDLIAAESPRDSGGAAVAYSAAVVSGPGSNEVALFYSRASGAVFPNGGTPVVCTAVDQCGNSNSCSFQVRVIPFRLIVTNTEDAGPGSLRQAIQDANDSPDANYIGFRIPANGAPAIHLLSPLPAISSSIFIDGWSQSTSSNGPPAVELSGPGGTNGFDGLVVNAGNSVIRGLALNGFANAIVLNQPGGNTVQANYIGTDISGTLPAGNSGQGIYVTSGSNLIGGTNGPNRIAYNGQNGIALSLDAGQHDGIHANRIYANGALGLDLGNDGVTSNHTGAVLIGPNRFQNYPVLTDAQSSGGTTTIYGQLTSTPNSTFLLEFYLNDMADPSGYGEGQIYLGSASLSIYGSGTQEFIFPFPVDATFTQFITATATDDADNTSEFSAAIPVRNPPTLTSQPVSTNALFGGTATFCSSATGTPPLYYQWRLNGVNIPGATNQCYIVPAAELTNGGTYTVLVANDVGGLASVPVTLGLPATNLQAADNFADRVLLPGTNGLVTGTTENATAEPGEPLHAGKFGGKSVWYQWISDETGVVTMDTLGSTFDTLLAAYTGTNVADLQVRESDDDQGGLYTSRIRFNSIQSVPYAVAIDGFGGDSGTYLLSYSFERNPHLLPEFWVQPTNQTVTTGGTAWLAALPVRVCGEGVDNCPNPLHYPEDVLPGLAYQWLFYDNPIPGATNTSLVISNVTAGDVGNYRLRVWSRWQTNDSHVAVLQINDSGTAPLPYQATDKVIDQGENPPIFLGVTVSAPTASGNGPQPLAAGTVVRGYTGTQVFNTAGSATSPTEIMCGVIGGASEWLTFVPVESGTLFLNTDGSSYDTVMGVFRRSPTNATLLQLIVCDNNSGTNGKTSAVSVPVLAGQTNFVDIDGVNGASGVLVLNYSLVTRVRLQSLGAESDGSQHLLVTGRTNMNFSIQFSTNLFDWVSVITTNSPAASFEYHDRPPAECVRGYYRARVLP